MRNGVVALFLVLGCDARPHDGGTMNEAGWQFRLGHWERRQSVIAKTGDYRGYNVALLEDQRFSDVDAAVRFMPISGRVDASGGIVFRARDAQTYYVVRANALEDNFRLYVTVDGKRRQLAGATVKEPAMGQWHSLRVVAKGDRIEAYLNGERLLDHRDGTLAEGFVGLWTKEDSVTDFDGFVVKQP